MKIVNETNFDNEVLNSNIPVIIDFFATWCGPCKMLAPTFEELAKEYDGKVKFVKVDIDESPNLASKYKIRGVPTLLIIKNNEVISTMVGVQPKQKIIDELSKVL